MERSKTQLQGGEWGATAGCRLKKKKKQNKTNNNRNHPEDNRISEEAGAQLDFSLLLLLVNIADSKESILEYILCVSYFGFLLSPPPQMQATLQSKQPNHTQLYSGLQVWQSHESLN